MEHAKELQQLLKHYFNDTRHTLECLTFIILGLFVVRSINMAKLARSFPTKSKETSVYKRLQRFMKRFTFSHKRLYQSICEIFALPMPITLCMDRTNWKFGKKHINYLVVSIAYKGVSIPFMWSLLTDKKCGNSDFEDRRKLFDQLLQFIAPSQMKCVLCDREFLSGDWIAYLKSHKISYTIRAKECFLVTNSKGKTMSFKKMFANLKSGKSAVLKSPRNVLGCDVYVCARRLDTGGLLILVSDYHGKASFDQYRKRWEIETLFSAMKTRGFNWEDTHITDPDRLSNILFILTLALVWSYRQGDMLMEIYPEKLKNHGFPQRSIVRKGMNFISKSLSEVVISTSKIIASIKLVFELKLTKIQTEKLLSVL
ncbi:IS4 family transposase [Cysteiniphilum halobium]|uniref:IS4 family transposase n=1 Tax=Cysteiniphilum halobium TaxID=2219059 RepID=UPI000E657A3B|nr:IS4 family transposase [Cysteiniphilum halobium]